MPNKRWRDWRYRKSFGYNWARKSTGSSWRARRQRRGSDGIINKIYWPAH